MGKDSFREFVLDQLHGLGSVACKRMFGGYGLYSGAVFFAIIARDQLYFKVNEETVRRFLERGMKPFQATERQTLKTYYEVPASVLEDDEELVQWARGAVSSQTGTKTNSRIRKKKSPRRA